MGTRSVCVGAGIAGAHVCVGAFAYASAYAYAYAYAWAARQACVRGCVVAWLRACVCVCVCLCVLTFGQERSRFGSHCLDNGLVVGKQQCGQGCAGADLF